MSIILKVIIITTIAGVGGTGLGGLVGAMFKKDSQKMVSLLLSFAGGVMLSIVCFDLILEALGEGGQNLWMGIVSIVVGYGVIFLLNHFIDRHSYNEVEHLDDEHPRTADDLGELIHSKHLNSHRAKRSGLFVAGLVMASAIALHNLPEGIIIGASYARDASEIANNSGLIIAIMIGLHNIPEGMAVSVPLISGGDKKMHAVIITALSGLPTTIGAIIGYYVGTISATMLTFSLGFASGAMLYVVFGELLPEAILMWRSKAPAFATIVGMIVGMLIIYL